MKKKIAKFIGEYSQPLSRLCTALCKNQHDAQDLFQSTWEKVIKSYKSFDETRPFDKWLYSVCVNCFKDNIKSAEKKKTIAFDSSDETARYLSTIEDFAGRSDEYISLHKAIHSLPVELREVIILYYFSDHSICEVAQILSIPQGTVKSRLHTAREELKRGLKNEQ